MSDVRSLTVNRPLVERLQPAICCSGTQETCRDDDFCSSNASTWPRLNNGNERTRLTYPADSEKPSIPGVPSFCNAYLDWYTKTNCGPLAKDIAMGMASPGHCTASVNPQAYIDRILKQVAPENRPLLEPILTEEMKGYALPASQSCLEQERIVAKLRQTLENRCFILYDDAPGGKRFNPDRAEDLNNLAEFCQAVGTSEQRRPHWKDFFKGGGAVAGVLGVLYALYLGGKAIIRISRGVSDAERALNYGSKGLKNFFGVTLQNFGRSMKYIFGFGWLRGKAPPPDVVAPPPEVLGGPPAGAADGVGGSPPPDPAGAHPAERPEVIPHPDVVRAQFANLSGSEHHSKEGTRFQLLSDLAQRYLSHHIIDLWEKETPERQRFFIGDDSRLTEAKLPIGFLLQEARRLLAEDMLPVIEASARAWEGRIRAGAPVRRFQLLALTVEPSLDEVQHQLITDPRYSRLGLEGRKYIARKIIAKWESLGDEERFSFTSPQDRLDSSALPLSFIRFFRKKELHDLRAIEHQGRAFMQLLRDAPELSPSPFPLIDARARGLRSAWGMLPTSIQGAFAALDPQEGRTSTPLAFPHAFVGHMRRTLWRGASPRPALPPAPEPWNIDDAEQHFIEGYDLREVMEAIALLNGPLRYYPAFLKSRAQTILDGWLDLNEGLRALFLQHEIVDGGADATSLSSMEPHVPALYVRLWHEMASGVGTAPRHALDIPADGPEEALPAASMLAIVKDPKKGGSSGPANGAPPGGGMPTGGGDDSGVKASSLARGVGKALFGGLVFAPEYSPGDMTPANQNAQPMGPDEEGVVVSGAEFLNGGVVPSMPPAVLLRAGGSTVITW